MLKGNETRLFTEEEDMPANLKSILEPDDIMIAERAENWQSAVTLAVQPLEHEGAVDSGYSRQIIDNTFRYGPYYVLIPEAALLHAKYDGVRRTHLAVTLLREKVSFSEKKNQVRILIALATDSTNTHIEYLRSIVQILKDKEKIEQILEAQSPGDVYRLFTED